MASRALAPAAALLGAALAAAFPSAATEYTRYLPVTLPAAAPMAATLQVPAGWRAGDATVVLLYDIAEPPALRDSMVSSLLAAQEAVLEVPHAALEAALMAIEERAVSGPVLLLGLGEAASRAAMQHDAPPQGVVQALAAISPGEARFRMTGGPVRMQTARSFCEAVAWGLSAAPTPLPQLAGIRAAAAWEGCLRSLDPAR